MDNVKNDEYYINRIIGDLAFIIRHMKDVDAEEYSGNEILQDSMMFRLIQISENARKLSDGYKERYTDIPWTAMTGLRNRIVHDYGNVNHAIIFDTLKQDIPALSDSIIRHRTLEERAAEYGGKLNLDGELSWKSDPAGREIW